MVHFQRPTIQPSVDSSDRFLRSSSTVSPTAPRGSHCTAPHTPATASTAGEPLCSSREGTKIFISEIFPHQPSLTLPTLDSVPSKMGSFANSSGFCRTLPSHNTPPRFTAPSTPASSFCVPDATERGTIFSAISSFPGSATNKEQKTIKYNYRGRTNHVAYQHQYQPTAYIALTDSFPHSLTHLTHLYT